MTETAKTEPLPTAVITGDGDLPKMVARALQARANPLTLVGFEGIAPDWIREHDNIVQPFEKAGRLFSALRERDIKRIIFAGAMSRPKLNPLRFDLTAMRLAPKVMRLLRRGDDETLRGLMDIFEDEGFRVEAPHDHLADLIPDAGFKGKVQPSETDEADAARAATILDGLGAVDVGQACVVAGGICLGVESIQGTDAMLGFVGRTADPFRDDARGVLYKAPKPGQDWRADLPAIGPETIRRAAEAGLSAVVIEAGGVLVIGLEETIAEADRLNIALWVRETG